jgi:hypothetical protein
VSPDNQSKNKSEINSVVTLITFGTVAWLIAGIYLFIADADSKAVWTCVVGALLGAWGIRYSKRRAARSGI